MNDPIIAKYYRDLHVLERIGDCNFASAIATGVNPSTYLNLNPKNYLGFVFRSILGRLNPIEIIEELNKSIEEVAGQTYDSNPSKEVGELTRLLREKVQIKDLAKKYSLKIKGDKTVCPFHKDESPSLVFYPKTNSFYCFGCRVGGDVIEFYRRMESR